MTVSYCNFLNNVGSNSGGAINVYQFSDTSLVHINKSTFTNNSASAGGAIFVNSVSTTVVIKNCSFLANTAVEKGGALAFNDGDSIIISTSSFQDNLVGSHVSTHTTSSTGKGKGGAVYFSAISIELVNTNFKNNEAASGGALFFEAAASLVVQESEFSGNIANNGVGGAVAIIVSYDVNITRCKVEGNVATGDGGGLYVQDGDNICITLGHLVNNQATSGNGGALTLFNIMDITISSKFHGNIARNGGATHISHNSPINVVIETSVYHNNTARDSGGAVECQLGLGDGYSCLKL